MVVARMSDEVEVRTVSVMRRNGKKYNKLLKFQAIRPLLSHRIIPHRCIGPAMERERERDRSQSSIGFLVNTAPSPVVNDPIRVLPSLLKVSPIC